MFLFLHHVSEAEGWTLGCEVCWDVSGSALQKLVSSQWGVSGLAVDWLEDRVYWTNVEQGDGWTNEGTGEIRSVSITGEDQETVVSGLERPCCLVLDAHRR